jgi:hypothetical protein
MFVSHTLLWPTETATLEQLRKRAAALPGRWLVRVLSALQWILRDEIGRHEWSKGYAFLEEFGDPVTARKAYAWLVTGRAWTIFDRSTIPALMQVRLVCGPDADRSVDSADMRELTQLLLITNDLLSVDRGSARRTTTGVDTTLLALTYRSGFYGHRPHWGAATARNWALLTAGLDWAQKQHSNEWYDAREEYTIRHGLTPSELQSVTMAAISHYESISADEFLANPEHLLLNAAFADALGDGALRLPARASVGLMAADWNAHASAMTDAVAGNEANLQQFSSLYNRPLFLWNDDTFFPLDHRFLLAQTTDGWYWSLVRKLSEEGRDDDVKRLHGVFGRAFEWYCSEVARPLRATGVDVYLDCDGDIRAQSGISVPDVVIRDGDTLFVAEMSTIAITPSASISGEATRLEAAIRGVWFGRSPKMRQLSGACEGITSGTTRLGGSAMTGMRRVIPLLVGLRHMPQFIGLWHWYRDIMREGGLSSEFIDRVCILSAEDWEEFCMAGLTGKGLAASFDGWKESNWQSMNFEDWRSAVEGDRPLHPVVQDYLRAYWQELSSRLGIEPPDLA